MLIGTAIAVVAIGVAIAFASTAGNGGGNPSGSTPAPGANSGEPSSIPSVDSPAAAGAVVKRVTLKPADWGSGYVADSPYENSDLTQNVVDQNCNWSIQPIKDAFATLTRWSKTSGKTVSAVSWTTVYKAPEPAQYSASEQREALQRCPTQSSGKSRIEGIHEIKIPGLNGFDEVVAEEGHQVSDENGNKIDDYYTYLTGRKGKFVLHTEVDRGESGTQEQNRTDASSALSLMLSRLESGASY
ncbi:hypothetical protein [Streptomyces endophytica]|uniref:PknH-like extracellular domain-containing protein n=1 Tax=Streptomyces endophytica TaxID=2991496 RepID=A0ABY6PFI6_9ACTN|nr:hypothetical protein [Streptomyces endophytica]UZJ31977.1 hypothetical protein OJ254_18945 [Streptomyces endophytica]